MFEEDVCDISVAIYKADFINYFLDLLWSQLFSYEHLIDKNCQIYLILFPYYRLYFLNSFCHRHFGLFVNRRIPALKNEELIDILPFDQLPIKHLFHCLLQNILWILPLLFKGKTDLRNFKLILILGVSVCQDKLLQL